MFGYLDYCHWLDPKEEEHIKECITFTDYTEIDESVLWLFHRNWIIKMEWANVPPLIN